VIHYLDQKLRRHVKFDKHSANYDHYDAETVTIVEYDALYVCDVDAR